MRIFALSTFTFIAVLCTGILASEILEGVSDYLNLPIWLEAIIRTSGLLIVVESLSRSILKENGSESV